jgi:transcriptional regulator with XRE-family HTH domain
MKRKEQNKTLREVSEKADVSLSFISKIENDQIKANLDHIKGILEDLEIKEEVFQLSQDMSKWYEDLLDYELDLGNPNISFKPVTENRDDFQSKIIDLAVNVKKGYYGQSEQNITMLITAMDNMKPIEIAIFLLIVAEYYIQVDEYFKSAELLEIVCKKEFVHEKVNLWLHELLFKLALCSKNEHYVSQLFNYLQQMYIIYNLYGKSTEKRMEYIKYCAYIKDEIFFKKLLSFDDHTEHKKAYMLHIFLNKKISKLKQELEQVGEDTSFSLIQTLYYHETKQSQKAEFWAIQLCDHPYDSPIEQFYKNYMKAIYVTKDPGQYLKSVLGVKGNLFHHVAVIEIAFEYYVELLMEAHRYKECTTIMQMVSKRLNEIRKNLEIF